jgi:carbamoyltransferase
MTAILGINAFHADSAACLVVDGVLRGAIAEERLGARLKHSPRFPENAIRRLLSDAGLRLRDVSHVAIARNHHANYAAKARYVLARPRRSAMAVIEHVRRNRKARGLHERLADICGDDPKEATFRIVPVEHHLAHIASAYYLSPFDQLTAALSYDASGDFVSLMAARCEGTRIEVLDRVHLPQSLGFFYTAICQLIGFEEFGEEYKVMGLAPYGEDVFADRMKELVRENEDGWFSLDTRCFGMHEGGESGALTDEGRVAMGRLYTDRLVERLGPPRRRADPLEQRHKDIARSCQARFEEVAVHCLRRLHRLVGTERLAMAGGCSLNGVANARILRETPFRSCYIQAAASDDGTCLGAAYHCWHAVLGRTERFGMRQAFWGPGYSDERLREAAEGSGFRVESFAGDSLVEEVAKHLVKGQVVGWYQGRSEWGPRALGNRSILANPTLPHMKDLINAKIKRRESFRPFAPSVQRGQVGTYFEQDIESPFMMHVVKIRPEWRQRLPAVTHVDGTGRLQSVAREDNPVYYDLIEAFRRRTGVGALLNTSFNENEPIVDSPEQAIDCFRRTGIDVLCLGRYVLTRAVQGSTQT